MDPMLVAVGSVLVASLLGSLHCAGMCGGLMLFAIGADGQTDAKTKARLQMGYHGGRMVTYTILGVIAGSIGAALDFTGGFVGVSRAAAVLAGSVMILFGVVTILRLSGVQIKRLKIPLFLQRFVERSQRAAFGLSPMRRAVMIGLLTTLLPCGWLYLFAFVAAGTGSPVWGGATMLAFWVGTLPVMVSLGTGMQMISGPLHAKMPMITALLIVVVGVYTAMGRLNAPLMSREAIGAPVNNEVVIPASPDGHCPLCED
ncbi:MAG: sulfite exporter TauE/SafE family protein [Phycisphaerales bacterium]|nr:sulfite exporter TauE/SafE family protein [Phycisphaerales bacterium]